MSGVMRSNAFGSHTHSVPISSNLNRQQSLSANLVAYWKLEETVSSKRQRLDLYNLTKQIRSILHPEHHISSSNSDPSIPSALPLFKFYVNGAFEQEIHLPNPLKDISSLIAASDDQNLAASVDWVRINNAIEIIRIKLIDKNGALASGFVSLFGS